MVEMFDNTYKSVSKVRLGDFIKVNNGNLFAEVRKIHIHFVKKDVAVVVEGNYIQKNTVIENDYYPTENVGGFYGYNFTLSIGNTVLVNGVICRTE